LSDSKDIFHCLHAITASVPSCSVPSQQSGVEDRLLQEVSLCLAGTPNAAGICDPRSEYRVVGLPERILSSSDRQEYTSKGILSLRTLGTFGDGDGMASIEGIRLPNLLFVRDVAMHYLLHSSCEVWRAATLTCCTLMISFSYRLPENPTVLNLNVQYAAIKCRLGTHSGRVVEGVLMRLLEVAVSDPWPVVRLCVVRALDERYDYF
jgi:serine/threonine-protein kinase mTOR